MKRKYVELHKFEKISGLSVSVSHPRFFDEQLSSVVGAIEYVRGSGNRFLTSIVIDVLTFVN